MRQKKSQWIAPDNAVKKDPIIERDRMTPDGVWIKTIDLPFGAAVPEPRRLHPLAALLLITGLSAGLWCAVVALICLVTQ